MKPSHLNFIFFLFIAIGTFGASCKSPENAVQNKDFPMYLMLKTNLSGDYIEKEYSPYMPSKINASNRTLNQYRVIFTCTAEAKKALTADLKADSNIISIEFGESDTGIQKSSRTNVKVSKTTPKTAKR
jgi:hypothetical protein